MREKIRAIYAWDGFPFLLLAAAMLLLHWMVPGLTKDDRYYWNILNEQKTFDYLAENWNNWTSRLFIEGVAIWVEHLPMVIWKVLDTCVYTSLGLVISALFFKEHKRTLNGWLTCLLLLYPFTDMSTAGWMTTTITYLWPLAAGLAVCLYFARVLEGRRIRWWEYPLYVIGTLYAGSLEQMSAVMTAVCLVLCVALFWKKRGRVFGAVLFALSAVNLAAALLCPGNAARTGTEIKQAFKDYGMLTLADKLQLGYSSTLKKLFFEPELLMILVFLLVAAITFLKTKDAFFRGAALLPVSAAVICGPFRGLLADALPGLAKMEEQFGRYGSVELGNFDWKRTWVVLIFLGLACVALVTAVYGLYGSCLRGWLVIFILMLGFATRMVMGFSPTIWKSSSRTYLFLLFAMLVAAAILLHDFYERYGERGREGIRWTLGIGAVVMYVSTLVQMI